MGCYDITNAMGTFIVRKLQKRERQGINKRFEYSASDLGSRIQKEEHGREKGSLMP